MSLAAPNPCSNQELRDYLTARALLKNYPEQLFALGAAHPETAKQFAKPLVKALKEGRDPQPRDVIAMFTPTVVEKAKAECLKLDLCDGAARGLAWQGVVRFLSPQEALRVARLDQAFYQAMLFLNPLQHCTLTLSIKEGWRTSLETAELKLHASHVLLDRTVCREMKDKQKLYWLPSHWVCGRETTIDAPDTLLRGSARRRRLCLLSGVSHLRVEDLGGMLVKDVFATAVLGQLDKIKELDVDIEVSKQHSNAAGQSFAFAQQLFSRYADKLVSLDIQYQGGGISGAGDAFLLRNVHLPEAKNVRIGGRGLKIQNVSWPNAEVLLIRGDWFGPLRFESTDTAACVENTLADAFKVIKIPHRHFTVFAAQIAALAGPAKRKVAFELVPRSPLQEDDWSDDMYISSAEQEAIQDVYSNAVSSRIEIHDVDTLEDLAKQWGEALQNASAANPRLFHPVEGVQSVVVHVSCMGEDPETELKTSVLGKLLLGNNFVLNSNEESWCYVFSR